MIVNKAPDLLLSESLLDRVTIDRWRENDSFFVPTKACKEVEILTRKKNLVVVTGHSGSGKSAVIQHIALKYRSNGWSVKPVYSVRNIIKIMNSLNNELQNKTLFVLNDPIGKESFDEIEYNSWRKHEENLESSVKKVKLLLSCRTYILNDNRVKGVLKNASNIVNLSTDNLRLSTDEKKMIWNMYSSNQTVCEEEITEIIQTDAYFPLLCNLYYSKQIKEKNRRRFFSEPVTVYEEEIRDFRKSFKEKYCALILIVLFNNDLCVDDMKKNETSRKKFQLALDLSEMNSNTASHTIGDSLETLQGFFVKKIGDTYSFYHDFVMEVTTYVLGTDYPAYTIKYADIGFLRKRVKLHCDENNQFTIRLSDKHMGDLVERLFNDVYGNRLLEVVLNPCLKNKKIANMFNEKFEHHPEKLKLLLDKIEAQIEKKEVNWNSKQVLLSKIDFLSSKKGASPLIAILVFCDITISLYCLKALQQKSHHLNGHGVLSAVCCNGSMDLFSFFKKNFVKESLSQKWHSFYPIHFVSVFHNYEILFKLIEIGVDVNLKAEHQECWTPLALAAGNETEEKDENKVNNSQSRRDVTIEVLLRNGAEIDLCIENGTIPLFLACQSGYYSTVQLLLKNKANINLFEKDGTSPLTAACNNGHDSTVDLLLRNGADVNSCSKDGYSSLHVACQNGSEIIVQLLLSNKADINACSVRGFVPLYIACQNGYDGIVQLLLTNGAIVNLCAEDGSTPLHISCQVGQKIIVEELLKNKAEINLCSENRTSPLHIACRNEYEGIVQVLLISGACVNLCTENGMSPLYIACQNGNDTIVQLLIDNGADINSCVEDGANPLHMSCQEGHNKTVEILLEACNGKNVNSCRSDGASPLHLACLNGCYSTAHLLLEHGADINLCMNNGATPLHTACQYGHDTIVVFLLSRGANINSCTKNVVSPLYIACQGGYNNTIQILLNNGADINSCLEDGTAPLHLACQDGLDSTVQLLLCNGADINLCREDNTSPLFIACVNGRDSILQLLLRNEANVNLCSKIGISPLYAACDKGHERIVQLLLNNRAIVDFENGFNPLHIACYMGHKNIVQHLLINGANINLCLTNGNTPLSYACLQGHDATVKLLLRYGADVNVCMENGANPLHVACQREHQRLVQVLLSNGANINSTTNDGVNPLHFAC